MKEAMLAKVRQKSSRRRIRRTVSGEARKSRNASLVLGDKERKCLNLRDSSLKGTPGFLTGHGVPRVEPQSAGIKSLEDIYN